MSEEDVTDLRIEVATLRVTVQTLADEVKDLKNRMWKMMLISLAIGLGGGAGSMEIIRAVAGI